MFSRSALKKIDRNQKDESNISDQNFQYQTPFKLPNTSYTNVKNISNQHSMSNHSQGKDKLNLEFQNIFKQKQDLNNNPRQTYKISQEYEQDGEFLKIQLENIEKNFPFFENNFNFQTQYELQLEQNDNTYYIDENYQNLLLDDKVPTYFDDTIPKLNYGGLDYDPLYGIEQDDYMDINALYM